MESNSNNLLTLDQSPLLGFTAKSTANGYCGNEPPLHQFEWPFLITMVVYKMAASEDNEAASNVHQ